MTEDSWTLTHREMLEHAMRARIYTWAGEPLRRHHPASTERFTPEQRAAWTDLVNGGLVSPGGSIASITERGYQAAETWGLNPDQNLKGRIRS